MEHFEYQFTASPKKCKQQNQLGRKTRSPQQQNMRTHQTKNLEKRQRQVPPRSALKKLKEKSPQYTSIRITSSWC